MEVRDDRRYTDEHEWVLVVEGNRVKVGITDYAQDALGDVVFVELPDVGRDVAAGEGMAEVESTKSVADVYAPIEGTVGAGNERLRDSPELVNSSPYDDGWFVELELADVGKVDSLLDAAGYRAITE